MHVLPLPFGLALVLLPRRDARLVRTEKPPIRVRRATNHRECLLSDVFVAACRRPIA